METPGFQRATVIGAGAMGTLCATLLAERGVRSVLWGRSADHAASIRADGENRRYLPGRRIPEGVVPTHEEDVALADPELIVSAVPCQHIRSQWSSLLQQRSVIAPIMSVAKGIEVDTLLRPTQILRELAPGVPLAALTGPSLAGEIARGLPAVVVVASEDLQLATRIQAAMSSSTFRIYTNCDVVGAELGGAVKNVIGIAAGIADGLEMGNNAKASLLTRGLVEITRLGVALGADPNTFSGLAGIGDLMTTANSRLSRNHTAGEKIGRGWPLENVIRTSDGVIEGIETTRSVLALAQRRGVEMPITQAIHSVLFEGRDPMQAIEELMTRRLRAE